MNKKQIVIIVTLLVLIVCAGILATKTNNPLYVNGDLGDIGKEAVSLNNTTNNTSSKSTKSNFFAESKMNRDQRYAVLLQTLKAMIDDPNASKEAKEAASNKYTNAAMAKVNEGKVEEALVSKGFEENICNIDEDKVRITVKTKEQLTDKQAKIIKDTVMGITKLKDVEIEPTDK